MTTRGGNGSKWPLKGRLLCMSSLVLLLGCAGVKREKSAPKESGPAAIDQINLLAIPYAVDFDQVAGPDGFVVKVYGGSRNRPKPVPILAGSLELLMYEGIFRGADLNTSKPRHAWKYSAEQLKGYIGKTSIGPAYELAVRWGDAKPLTDRISVIARFISADGVTVYSAPSVISVPAR